MNERLNQILEAPSRKGLLESREDFIVPFLADVSEHGQEFDRRLAQFAQFEIAESNNFSSFGEPTFGSYFKILRALLTRSPRIRSATNLILRGDEGTLLNLATTGPVFAASFFASRFSLFTTDLLVFFAVASSAMIT